MGKNYYLSVKMGLRYSSFLLRIGFKDLKAIASRINIYVIVFADDKIEKFSYC